MNYDANDTHKPKIILIINTLKKKPESKNVAANENKTNWKLNDVHNIIMWKWKIILRVREVCLHSISW